MASTTDAGTPNAGCSNAGSPNARTPNAVAPNVIIPPMKLHIIFFEDSPDTTFCFTRIFQVQFTENEWQQILQLLPTPIPAPWLLPSNIPHVGVFSNQSYIQQMWKIIGNFLNTYIATNGEHDEKRFKAWCQYQLMKDCGFAAFQCIPPFHWVSL